LSLDYINCIKLYRYQNTTTTTKQVSVDEPPFVKKKVVAKLYRLVLFFLICNRFDKGTKRSTIRCYLKSR